MTPPRDGFYCPESFGSWESFHPSVCFADTSPTRGGFSSTTRQRLPSQGSWMRRRRRLRGLVTGRFVLSGTHRGRPAGRPYIQWQTPKIVQNALPVKRSARRGQDPALQIAENSVFLPYTSRQIVGAACRPPVGFAVAMQFYGITVRFRLPRRV